MSINFKFKSNNDQHHNHKSLKNLQNKHAHVSTPVSLPKQLYFADIESTSKLATNSLICCNGKINNNDHSMLSQNMGHTSNFNPNQNFTYNMWAFSCESWFQSNSYGSICIARFSCFIMLLPILLINYKNGDDSGSTTPSSTLNMINNTSGIRLASCFYLIIAPFSSYFLQLFSFLHAPSTLFSRFITCFLCMMCLMLGNTAAVLFLVLDTKYQYIAFSFLSSSIAFGCIQLLILLNKTSIFRVMICTGTSVLVIILSILALHNNSNASGRRFYQSASFPFLLLFYETTRSHMITTSTLSGT